jgi:hypothetical protein
MMCFFRHGTDPALLFDNTGTKISAYSPSIAASPGTPGSYQLYQQIDESSSTNVWPVAGTDSYIIADGNWVKRIKISDGSQIWPATSGSYAGDVGYRLGYKDGSSGHGNTMNRVVAGITPIHYTDGTGDHLAVAVTFNDGPVYSSTYANIVVFDATDGSFIAQYPPLPSGHTYPNTTDQSWTTGIQLSDNRYYWSASPPAAHNSSLYFAGENAGASNYGSLIKFDLTSSSLSLSATQFFKGLTGASPTYIDHNLYNDGSGHPSSDQVILHVPDATNLGSCTSTYGFPGAGTTGVHDYNNFIVSFDASTLSCTWRAKLFGNNSQDLGDGSPISVGPVVDPVNGGIWLWTTNYLGQSGQYLYHYPAAGNSFDTAINIGSICSACGTNAAFIGHNYLVKPSGASNEYLLTIAGSNHGVGTPNSSKTLVSIKLNTGALQWYQQFTDSTGNMYGGSIPMMTNSSGDPMAMFSFGTFGTYNIGEVIPVTY